MKITIEIRPFGHEIQDPIEGIDPKDWPVIGWFEGLRAVLSDVTNHEQVMRKTLEVEGMDDASFQKLSAAIKIELDQRFRSEHRDRINDDFESIFRHARTLGKVVEK